MTTAGGVQLTSVVRQPRLVLIPVLLMALLSSARGTCRLVRACIPLVGVLVPLPLEDAVDLASRRTR